MTIRSFSELHSIRTQNRRANCQIQSAGDIECGRGIIDTAMQLYREVPVELNEHVEIGLAPSISFRGNVVWVNGSNCGILFDCRDDGLVSVFVPGQRVTVLLGGDRQRCAVVRWTHDNIAELSLS